MKRISILLISCLLVLTTQVALYGQITLPDQIVAHDPIIAGCNCILPQDGIAEFVWRTDQNSKSVPAEKGTRLHIWAPPGDHYVEAIVITYREMMVFVPDPAAPNDPSKAKPEKIRVYVNMQRYDKHYKVTGTSPTPPGPTPPGPTPPGPTPPGPIPAGFAGEVRKMLDALKVANPTLYSKARVEGIANSYSSVAAEAVAVQGTYNLAAFVSKTKDLNRNVLKTAEEQAAWGAHVFNPIAKIQQQMASDRKIDLNSDEAGIAALWRETAEALTEAANSITMEIVR